MPQPTSQPSQQLSGVEMSKLSSKFCAQVFDLIKEIAPDEAEIVMDFRKRVYAYLTRGAPETISVESQIDLAELRDQIHNTWISKVTEAIGKSAEGADEYLDKNRKRLNSAQQEYGLAKLTYDNLLYINPDFLDYAPFRHQTDFTPTQITIADNMYVTPKYLYFEEGNHTRVCSRRVYVNC